MTSPAEYDVVREFFELFKTPWEVWQLGRRYDVILCAGAPCPDGANARLLVVYSASRRVAVAGTAPPVIAEHAGTTLSYDGARLPIYGRCVAVRGPGIGLVTERRQDVASVHIGRGGIPVAWLGYDLLVEVRRLLTRGQPVGHAASPTLELHIAVLRDLIATWAGPLVEIPPVPAGHAFVACLTHDLDNPSIHRHGWDRTALGFLARAIAGTPIQVLRGRADLRALVANWRAALTLPLVHMGRARDFWLAFDRYAEVDRGHPSTYFVIPFRDRPGRTRAGVAPSIRAARYAIDDVRPPLARLRAAGCEVALHGLDAWLDVDAARHELAQVAALTGVSQLGARIHWLYGDAESPAVLERAGCAYDSTCGYNETVGYRAGTAQAFQPLGATRLLELPLHVMDTALFFRRYLDLTPAAARARVRPILEHAVRRGGAVTVNWHDRSIAPERRWERSYVDLLADLEACNPWFATAHAAVTWFRKRRSAVFEETAAGVRVTAGADGGDGTPELRVRLHRACRDGGTAGGRADAGTDRVLRAGTLDVLQPRDDASPEDRAPALLAAAREPGR